MLLSFDLPGRRVLCDKLPVKTLGLESDVLLAHTLQTWQCYDPGSMSCSEGTLKSVCLHLVSIGLFPVILLSRCPFPFGVIDCTTVG